MVYTRNFEQSVYVQSLLSKILIILPGAQFTDRMITNKQTFQPLKMMRKRVIAYEHKQNL